MENVRQHFHENDKQQAQVWGPCKLPGSVCRNTCKVLLGNWDFMCIKLIVINLYLYVFIGKSGKFPILG